MINNKKSKNRQLIPALVLGVVLSSCSLTIEETDSLITQGESALFNGVENVDGSIDNLYSNISDQIATQENIYALSEVTTDIMLVPTRGTDWGDNGVWRTLHTHQWSGTHQFITNVWNNKNGGVLRASEVIDPLSNADPEQVAHAKFVRAYNMFWIMDCFGQVPYRNPTDGPDVIPSVYSRAEAYELVVNDLLDAIEDLPDGDPLSDNKQRATKATARWLLAKVKLNSGVYLATDPAIVGEPSAADLEEVIELVDAIEAEGFSLVGGDYFELFKGPTFTNSDVIWAVSADVASKMWNALHYSQGFTGGPGGALSAEPGGGWNGFTSLAEFYDSFEGPSNDNSIGMGQEERRGYTQTLETTNEVNEGFGFGFQLGQMYGWKDGKAVALQGRTGPLAFTKELPGLTGNNDVTGMRLLKYSPMNGAHQSGTVLARFSDAHLMRAEAMLRLGNNGALSEVNELRALRANTTPLASLDEAEMLAERGRELYMEYVRRNDMIRFGAFKNAWEFKEAGDGHTNLFPIPATALLSNPNLVQNPGY